MRIHSYKNTMLSSPANTPPAKPRSTARKPQTPHHPFKGKGLKKAYRVNIMCLR